MRNPNFPAGIPEASDVSRSVPGIRFCYSFTSKESKLDLLLRMASATSNPSTAGTLASKAQGLLTIPIEPARKWFELRLKELWTYRELLLVLVWRDVKVRYKQTGIGVCTFHQNHDCGYHSEEGKGVWEGEEALENYPLPERHRRIRTLDNATHLLEPDGMRWNYRAWYVQAKRDAYDQCSPVWVHLLDWTRPLCHRIGLRQKGNSAT
jgi:hypothetical protein